MTTQSLTTVATAALAALLLASCGGDAGDDPRKTVTPDENERESMLAPIESAVVNTIESFPPQYMVVVTSGLPNTCHEFEGYAVTRNGNTVNISVSNTRPVATDVMCAEIYGMVTTSINLGSDFDSADPYTIDVNGTVTTFRGQMNATHSESTVLPGRLNDLFHLRVGETIVIEPEGLEVALILVIEDTRCAIDAICATPGRARILLGVRSRNQDREIRELVLEGGRQRMASTGIGRCTLSLRTLGPYPGTVEGNPEYVATMIVAVSGLT